jgi:iron(III) transport system permease protein
MTTPTAALPVKAASGPRRDPRPAAARRRRPRLATVAVPAALVAALSLLPVVFLVVQAAGLGPHQAQQVLADNRLPSLLGSTAKIVAVGALLCAVTGTATAWLVERTTVPGRRVWRALLTSPLAVPAFVAGYAWTSFTSAVQGFGGALLITSLSLFPLVHLPVSAALRATDPALQESARALGLGPWQAFRRVVLPQVRPALLGGTLLVAVRLLSEFGAFQMLRYQTFTTAIYAQFQVGFDGPASDLLSLVLVVCCSALLAGEARMRTRARVARVGTGAARPPAPHRLGAAGTAAALLFLTALLGAAVGVPLVTLAGWLARGSSTAFPAADLATTAWHTVAFGLLAGAATTLLSLPVALLASRHGGRLGRALERLTYLSHALPGLAIALSLVFAATHYAYGLYQTLPVLIGAYAMKFLPRAQTAVRAALAQAPPGLTEAARACGSGPLAALVRVTLPLIGPGLAAALAMVFLSTATELTATLILAPIGVQTLATEVWQNVNSYAYGAAAPYAVAMIALSAPTTWLLHRSTAPQDAP